MKTQCDNPANFRVAWPGEDTKLVCTCCYIRLIQVKQAMGFHLAVEVLTKQEKSSSPKCQQKHPNKKGK